MTQTNEHETRDVLRMIQQGRISAAEGDGLLAALERNGSPTISCPYCAESIPADVANCPECHTCFGPARTPRPSAHSFTSLGALSKTLIIYQILVCSIVLLSNSLGFGIRTIPAGLLAALGIASAILMCKRNKLGWGLGILWVCAQIPVVVISNVKINTQLFYLGMLTTTNGNGFGVNLVGVILLVLFLAARKDWGDA